MSIKSTPTRYGRVAVVLHWSIAVLILVALVSGFAADAGGREAYAPLRAHVIAGFTAGVLTLVRIGWWWLADRKPEPAPNSDGLKGTTARIVHILLVIVPLGMAASGIGMMVLSGAGAQLLGGASGPLPVFEELLPRGPHGLGARALIALLVLHVGAALYHHFALRDGLMQRMWFAGNS